MRISHVCGECGRDMARDAAPPDPIYGLTIVRCTCGKAHVRSRANLRTGWRTANEYGKLAARVCVISWLVVGPAIAAISAGLELWGPTIRGGDFRTNLDNRLREEWPLLLMIALMVALAAIICSWLLDHLSAFKRTALFGFFLLASSAIASLVEAENYKTVIDVERLLSAAHAMLAWSLLLAACFAVLSIALDRVRLHKVFRPRFATRLAKARRRRQ